MNTPIVFATDDGYAMPTAVAIRSIINNCSCKEIYFFILYKDTLSNLSKSMIELATKCDRVVVFLEYLDVGNTITNAISHISHISAATYYRIALPIILPKYDQCLYLDGDILVTGDISPLCSLKLNDNEIVAGVPTIMIQTASQKVKNSRMEILGINSFDDYINAGVTLMNLRIMRDEGLVEKMLDMVPKNYPLQDQDIINVISYKRTLLLAPKYNAMPRLFRNDPKVKKVYSQKDIVEAKEAPIIIHYADKHKPWKYNNIPEGDRWRKIYWQLFNSISLENQRYGIVDKCTELISKVRKRFGFIVRK